MIKELLLISALVGTPVVMADETTPTEPVATETTTSEDFDWKAWLEQWFTPQQVTMIMTWLAYISTIITIVYKLYHMAKSKTLSNENLKELIMKELGDKVDSSVKAQITAIAIPLLETEKKQEEVVAVLVKIMALSQENTPESRIAILNCISSLGVVDKQVLEQSKQAIDTQVKQEEAKKVATQEAVDKVIETTSKKDDGTQLI